ncbi:OPT/YSL family transporter [bacterium]|nr:OPT/YSL family transporter [bacterium]MBU1637379.1 OPT/YSL family transporter [bacterium]MBU1921552.1 OPT/YSL family transporter [bacterium]
MADKDVEKKMTPEELEREWYEEVYRGDDMPQLTLRSIIMGSILGGVLSLQNLYVGLKTGWGLGVAITSCILSFTIWKTLRKIMPRIFKTDMSILENNAMQSTASSAGYSTGGTIVSAIAAYLLVNGVHIGYGLLSAWVFFLAVLGVTMAIPMKRQMINIERLKFPSGIAAAETLKSLHGVRDKKDEGKEHDGGDESSSAKALFVWGGIGIAIAAVRDWFGWIPALWNTFGSRAAMYTVQFDASMILVAAGALMGFKVSLSLLIGGILNWGILAPIMMDKEVIGHPIPYVRSAENLSFPLSVPAGHSLRFQIIVANEDFLFEDGSDTTNLEYVWSAPVTYSNMQELVASLNSPYLPTGESNPLYGKLYAAKPVDAYLANRLEMRIDSSIHRAQYYESELVLVDDYMEIKAAGVASQLLSIHKSEANELQLKPKFPLEIPGGFSLPISLSEGSNSNIFMYTWPDTIEYSNAAALLADLKSPRMKNGDPNLLAGAFELKAQDEALSIVAPSTSSMFAFEQGVSNNQQPGGYRNIVSWSLWAGAACMVTSGLLTFAFEWRTALRAFSGLKTIFSRKEKGIEEDPLERIEVPGSWFAGGMIIGTIGIVWLAALYFEIPVWMGILAVILSFFLALVACRACGETDTTPVGAMGKITQLTYGAIAPKQMNTNLMAACITAGVADSASDLLTDLKSGYVLGANARKQFLAQFAGIFIGTAVTVPAFFLVVPDVSILGSTKFPAPAAQVWASVARLLSNGFESLHPTARAALIIGGIVGLLIPMFSRMFPKWSKYVPSAMGLGLAFVLPFYNALSMFIGGLIALFYIKARPKGGEQYTVASASGIIAGESLMGIFITLLFALGFIA